ncbi:MAG: M20/M25/M40 family metallo-hydrolase [Anaerolineae bacterium]|nr:M20/M25/M40 family metallo-hydrolase [Anaerolineae bacterium]
MKELIKKLVEAWGPSGYEHEVRALIQEEVSNLADDMYVDPLGNLICRVGSGGKKIMVSSHMDEIGLMATFIEPKSGYLRFANIGGLNKTTLFGNRVRFENGVIGVIGAHDSWNAQDDLNNFYVDVSDGNGSHLVEEGSPAALWRGMEERGTRLVSKAMDDRIGCVVAIEAMRKLNKKTPNEVYFAFTVQEEVGLRGARTAAYGISPDVGIALDVTATGDEIKNRKMGVKLGGGAAIKIHDPGLVVPPAVRDWMVDRAEADGVPYQLELLTGGTTDAAAIQLTQAGVPSGCISIPCRFVHTTSETVDIRDVQACVDLLAGLLGNPVAI